MTNLQNIDKYIDAACRSGEQADYSALFQHLQGKEIYFNLEEDGNIQISSNRHINNGTPGIVCYCSVDDENLHEPYAKLAWEDALNMLVDIPEDVILVLQSSSSAWVGISQDTASTLLRENTDNSDLNEIVIKASASQEDEDYYGFFIAAYNRYLFVPVDDEDRSIKVATATNDLNVIVFFLEPSSAHTFDSIRWQDCLMLVLEDPDIDGIIVQSNSGENIALSREKIEQLQSIYEQWNQQPN
jgi:hypothetical protein